MEGKFKNNTLNFHFHEIYRDIKKDLEISLYKADINLSADEYIHYSFYLSVFISMLFSLFFAQDPAFDLFSLLVIFIALLIAVFLLLKNIPKSIAKSRAAEIESDLPIAIRSIGIQLNMKVPFESALESVANSNYKCSSEFKKVIKMIDGGATIPDSLRQMAERVDSQLVKKLIVQLIHVYLEGQDGTELKHGADELIHSQRFKFKEFSAKLSFLSLMFIAVAAIAPTMYLAYVVVSSLYFGTQTSPSDIWFIFIFIFPLIDLILILYIKMSTPYVLTNLSEPLFSKREQIMLNEELKNFGINLEFKKFITSIFLLSIFLAALTVYFVSIYGLLFLLLPILIYFIFLWSIDRRSNEIEHYLPDALLYAATLEYGIPMEKIIENISNAGYHSLSREFKKAERQINVGINLTHALLNMKDRNNSLLLDRVISLLIQCYKTGKDVHQAIKETADDIFELNMLRKEQASSLSLQKYTILLGGCIFVPLILSVILNVVSGIQPLNEDPTTLLLKNELIKTASDAIQIYLVLYVLLSSIFVAMQEGRLRTFIGYFILFLPVVLILFNIGKEIIRF